MTFRPSHCLCDACIARLLLAGLLCLSKWHRPAWARLSFPERTIYPGEELSADLVREVDVTNPNLRAGYITITSEVLGKVTTRTLLPGRTIPAGALRDAWAVERGTTVALVFSGNGLTITAAGTPLENAASATSSVFATSNPG
jgi:flagella basal body P-ring formation protein FlgA